MQWNREEHKARTIFYYVGVIVLCLVIIGMVVDFINWKEAISMIKEEIPTEMNIVHPPEFIKGVGWIPIVWRGNFKRISVMAHGTPDSIKDIEFVVIQIGSHESFYVNLKDGYGSKSFKNTNDNTWYNQEFDNVFVFAKVKVQEIKWKEGYHQAKVQIFIYIETESRHYVTQVYTTLYFKPCGGGYWRGGWKK